MNNHKKLQTKNKKFGFPRFTLKKSQSEIMVDNSLHTKVNIYSLLERQIYKNV